MANDISGLIQRTNILAKKDALALVASVVSANESVPFQKGAVVDFTLADHQGKEIWVVGDLHGRCDNLERIIKHGENLEKIRSGTAVLLFLGDAVHGEMKRHTTDEGVLERLVTMDDSIATIMSIMRLKAAFPQNVFYCLGNHDYLSKKFRKGGIMQGWVFREALMKQYGKDMVAAYEKFIATSPLIFIGSGIVANHAGPIDDVYSLDQLKAKGVTADEGAPFIEQCLWRRWKHYQSFLSYDEEHVKKFLMNVIGQPEAVYLVGHSPNLLYYDEYRINAFTARLMAQHYMVFGGYDACGYGRFVNGSSPASIEFVEV
jgi:hypothetical protein